MPNLRSVPFRGPVLPESALHAAELELKGLGKLHVRLAKMFYKDTSTGINIAKWGYKDAREANLQMNFFRVSAKDRQNTRAHLRVVIAGVEA